MTDLRVRVDEISKMFMVGEGGAGAIGSVKQDLRHYGPLVLGLPSREDKQTLWALKNVSFEVRAGEVVGIIGRNGSGKSTLLKILSRVTEPSSGAFKVWGSVGSLLEVGTGFHPDLTGRQNIYLNGSILGMNTAEVDRHFDEIVAFAEVERFIDTPVRHYSSGMYMRLAFSVAAHLEREILLIDEVLAVGDVGFQRKCLAMMRNSIRDGRTVFFVSHASAIILQVCTRALWLDKGRLIADGSPHDVVERYVSSDMPVEGERSWEDASAPRFHDGAVALRRVRLLDRNEVVRSMFETKEEFSIEVEFEILEKRHTLAVHLYFAHDTAGKLFVSMDNLTSPWKDTPQEPGRYVARCNIPAHFLNEGTFTIEATISTNPSSRNFLEAPDVLIFRIFDDLALEGVRGNWGREWPPAAIRPRLEWNHMRVSSDGQ